MFSASHDAKLPPSSLEWVRQRDQARKLWVIAVLAFWVTGVVLAVVYVLNDELDLVLVSIALGMMVLGVWLKARYQLILRREPHDHEHGEDHQPRV